MFQIRDSLGRVLMGHVLRKDEPPSARARLGAFLSGRFNFRRKLPLFGASCPGTGEATFVFLSQTSELIP
jgi:hypothetical protein